MARSLAKPSMLPLFTCAMTWSNPCSGDTMICVIGWPLASSTASPEAGRTDTGPPTGGGAGFDSVPVRPSYWSPFAIRR